MQTFFDGISLVQLGILTNTESIVEEGIFTIKTSAGILKEGDKPSGFPSLDKAKEHAYTKKNLQELNMHTDELLKQFKAGDVTAVLKEYNSIMLQCVECHVEQRYYKDRGHGFR